MSNIVPPIADPVMVFPLSRWCPPQETSQPNPPHFHQKATMSYNISYITPKNVIWKNVIGIFHYPNIWGGNGGDKTGRGDYQVFPSNNLPLSLLCQPLSLRHWRDCQPGVGIFLIGPLGTNFGEIFIKIDIFSFKKILLKMPSAKWHLFLLGLNVLDIKKPCYQYRGYHYIDKIAVW